MIGERLGPYHIERELGSGGMGTVYLASVDEGNGSQVALKVVLPRLARSEKFAERFRREAEIGMAVDHPNVVRTFDAQECDGQHILAMEYVAGQTLGELLAELERVPEELCRHIAREVCKGLAAIHAAGAIHRDIKPENVLITPEHVVKVMDLGVAQLIDASTQLSQTGVFVGSLLYAAPESFSRGNRGLDGRVDLHALGLVLYELACGTNPYAADDMSSMIKNVLHEEPRRLGEANPQLSPFFEEVVHCLLAKDREARFGSAEELLAVLDAGEDAPWWHERARALQLATKRPLRRIRIPRETALYGREDELATLHELFEAAKDGDGRVLLLEGEAGIGKSRLVDEFVGRLQAAGEDLNFLFGTYPPGGAATASGAFSSAYRDQFGEQGSAGYLSETPSLVPAFDTLLWGSAPAEGQAALNKESLQTCFVNATRALAAERPTVILIDDLHFAPAEGRALFTALGMAVPGHQVLLIGTHRRGVAKEWIAGLARAEHTSQMSLGRLGPGDLVRLLDDTFHSRSLAEELAGKIGARSDGNPFFVFEIVRGLRDGQLLKQRPSGEWVTTKRIDEVTMPASALDLVNARVAELNAEERDLLDAAACCGFEFDPTLVAEALDLPLLATLKRFGQIERKHHLVRSAGRRLVFDHHQVQEALYDGLLVQLREHYHNSIGDALERRGSAGDAELCRHFLAGTEPERARPYIKDASRRLRKSHLLADGFALTKRALEIPGLLEGRERLHILLEHRADAGFLGRAPEADAAVKECLALAEQLGDADLSARSDNAAGTHFLHRDPQNARAYYERARDHAQRAGRRWVEEAAECGLGNAYLALGRLEQALAHCRRALEISEEGGDLGRQAANSTNLGSVLLRLDRLDESEAMHRRGLELARQAGNRYWELSALSNLGGIYHARGDSAAALDLARRSSAIAHEIGYRPPLATSTSACALVLSRFGALAEARSCYERARALAAELQLDLLIAYCDTGLGWIEEQEGRLDDADARHAEAANRTGFAGAEMRRAAALRGRVRVAWARADRAALGPLLDAAEAADAEPVVVAAYRALLGGDPPDTAALDADDTMVLTRIEVHFVLWQATSDMRHLTEAHRMLLNRRDATPEEYRTSFLENIALHRNVLAAWKEHGGET